jgi:hypothetical protein
MAERFRLSRSSTACFFRSAWEDPGCRRMEVPYKLDDRVDSALQNIFPVQFKMR